MAAGFTKECLDLTHERWEDVERYNAALQRLLALRKTAITVAGPLLNSKLAWKCAVVAQALLYRVTMLACGSAEMWNAGNVVCSIMAARALLETIAVSDYLANQLNAHIHARDLDALNELLNRHLFATRNAELVAEGVAYQATNVLTYIDRLGTKIPDIRSHYDFLSEWCHPNGSGHLFTYGDINKSTGEVLFSERTQRVVGIQGHVVTVFMMSSFMESNMEIFDKAVPKIAEIEAGAEPLLG